MPFADGARTLIAGGPPIPLAITTAVAAGDLLTESGGLADANATPPAPAAYVAGIAGVNGDTIPVYKSAVVSGVTGATKGNKVFLADTPGGYSETPSTTQRQTVGFSISTTQIYVEPRRDPERFAVSTGQIDTTHGVDRYFFAARERCRVTAVDEINTAVEATSNTTTLMIQKIVNANGIGGVGQKNLLAAAMNVKTGANANAQQSLALTGITPDLVLEKGNALALDITNAITEYAGCLTVWLEPA